MDNVALLTDRYEYTMLDAAVRDGLADRPCVFEAFTRSLPNGRRFGVLAGVGRLIDMIEEFTFDPDVLAWLADNNVVSPQTLDWLAAADMNDIVVDGYREGELFFPGSPVLTVTAPFGLGTLLETLVLSTINFDSAVASAAARMRLAAGTRQLVEMGTRRTNERSGVAAARAAYIAGFDATSNLAASVKYAVPSTGTAAHAFTLLYSARADAGDVVTAEQQAFDAQLAAQGPGTTLLIDTYDLERGTRHAVEAANRVGAPGPGAVRIDSGDPHVVVAEVRAQLDELGATGTRIVLTGDMDEFVIRSLRDQPVDTFGAGTALVTGSGAPTCGFVYKLVAVQHDSGSLAGVAKASANKQSAPGVKRAWRRIDSDGHASGECVSPRFTALTADAAGAVTADSADLRGLQVRHFAAGVAAPASAASARQHCREALAELRAMHTNLDPGQPAFTA